MKLNFEEDRSASCIPASTAGLNFEELFPRAAWRRVQAEPPRRRPLELALLLRRHPLTSGRIIAEQTLLEKPFN